MPITKPQGCTARPNCRMPPVCSFAWHGRTLYACSGHLQSAEETAAAMGQTIDPQPYPPPKPVTPPAKLEETEPAPPVAETPATKPPGR